MKKFFTILSIVTIAAFSANAQTGVSVGVEVGMPSGDFKETSKLGLGGSAKVAFPIMSQGAITASLGYLSFSGKEVTMSGVTFKYPAINLIPIKAGFRYAFQENGGFYVEPQIGYSFMSVKGGDSDGAFTYAGNLGYLINNMVDVSARYEAASKDGSSLSHIGLRIAYNFSLGGGSK